MGSKFWMQNWLNWFYMFWMSFPLLPSNFMEEITSNPEALSKNTQSLSMVSSHFWALLTSGLYPPLGLTPSPHSCSIHKSPCWQMCRYCNNNKYLSPSLPTSFYQKTLISNIVNKRKSMLTRLQNSNWFTKKRC